VIEEEREPGAGKRPYEKPELKQVQLRPEEAVLGNCKISATSGPATSNCGTFVCSAVGS
jgi:hypothetical protein